MADVWANSMACYPRATCHIARCCHLANSMSWSLSYVLHWRGAATGRDAWIPFFNIRILSVSVKNYLYLYPTVQTLLTAIRILSVSMVLLWYNYTASQKNFHQHFQLQLQHWLSDFNSFTARQHTDAQYWYGNSVRPSVRNVPVLDENGLTYRHSFFHHTVAQSF